jgi:hypothetical protein
MTHIADMRSTRKQRKKRLTEKDDIVESQSDDDSAWGKTDTRSQGKVGDNVYPSRISGKSSLLAKLHRENDVEDWLTKIIKERVEMEEVAFSEAKRQMSLRNGV